MFLLKLPVRVQLYSFRFFFCLKKLFIVSELDVGQRSEACSAKSPRRSGRRLASHETGSVSVFV